MTPADFRKPIDYVQEVKKPIDLTKARALADQIVSHELATQTSWFGALARCIVTLCDEVERLREKK